MKHLSLLSGTLVCIALFSQSCYYDNEEELYEHYNNLNPCDTAVVSFSSDIFPLIEGNCVTGCHIAGGTGNGIFENHASVKDKVDNGAMLQRVVVEQNMPPGGGLTQCQIDQMEAWILNGAPNN